jgi:hypothetical protein
MEKSNSVQCRPATQTPGLDKISGKLRLKQEIIDEFVENEEMYNSESF